MHSTGSLIFYCALSAIGSIIAVFVYNSKQIRMLKYLYLDLCLLYEDSNQLWHDSAISAIELINDRVENPEYKLQSTELNGPLLTDLVEWQERWSVKSRSNDKLLRRVGIIITMDDLSIPI